VKKIISIALSVMIVMTFVLGAYADSGRYYAKAKPKGNISVTIDIGSLNLDELKDVLLKYRFDKKIRKEILKKMKNEWKKAKKDYKDSISVVVNGRVIDLDVSPVIKSNRVLIPVRAVTSALGAEVIWRSSQPDLVTITKKVDNKDVVITINLKTGEVKKDGKVVEFDVKPQVIQNRTVVPIRFLAELFGMKVDYDHDCGCVFCDDEDEDEDEKEEENKDKIQPVLLSAKAISDTTISLEFSEDIKGTFDLKEGDIVVTDGTRTQLPTKAKISSESSATVLLTTESLDAYDFSKTRITVREGEFKDKAGNGNILASEIPVQDKYAKAATIAGIFDIDNTEGISGADFKIIWTPATDNVQYYEVYLFRAADKIIFNEKTIKNYDEVGVAVADANHITVYGTKDSTGAALRAEDRWVDDVSGYEAYVVSYDAYNNMAISEMGVNLTPIVAD